MTSYTNTFSYQTSLSFPGLPFPALPFPALLFRPIFSPAFSRRAFSVVQHLAHQAGKTVQNTAVQF